MKLSNKLVNTRSSWGPAADGGFYLVGMTSPGVDIFQSVPWSTNQALTKTVANIRESGLNYKLLAVNEDIDDKEDWYRWKMCLEKSEG